MKTSFSIRTIAPALFALAAFVFASNSYAFTFQKIVISSSDGKSIEVTVDENGNYKSPELKAGTYSFSWGLSQTPSGMNAAQFGIGRGIGSPMGGSGDREASAPSISEIVVTKTMDVVSPPDAASGLPTGKRMHKPITITKEIDKATPLLMTKLGEVVVDTDGTVISGTVSFKSSNGSPAKASWDLAKGTK
jgi:hypothetical protein